MTTEVKAISIISIITILVIILGLSLTKDGPQTPEVTVNQDHLFTSDNPKITSENAKITIVEFADFACPACAMLSPNLDEALNTNKDSVNFVLRLLPIHGADSYLSATAAFAAGEQGKFFEMGKLLYQNQSEWVGKSSKRESFISYATTLGIDVTKFTETYDSNDFQKKIKDILDTDSTDGTRMRIVSTPTLIIDDTPVVGVQKTETLNSLIQAAIAKKVDTEGMIQTDNTQAEAGSVNQNQSVNPQN